MSEAAVAPVAAHGGHSLSPRTRRNRLNPLEALECGFALFRSTFAREAWRYYAGAAPLVLCFIPMWVVDGQIRISNGMLLMETVLLAGAYLLRVWAVARYMHGVRESAFGVPAAKPAGRCRESCCVRTRLLAWKITLSAAALAALPTVGGTSWFYSACQFASFEASEDAAERHSIRDCLALASQWFGGGLLLFLMLFPLWVAVWLNGLILAIIRPAAAALGFWGEHPFVDGNGDPTRWSAVPHSGFRFSGVRGWHSIRSSNVRSWLSSINICGRGAKEMTCAGYLPACRANGKRKPR